MRFRSLVLAAFLIVAPTGALADPIADFYRGKQLKVIIRAAPGGNYDLYLRLLARHIVRFIPGNPTAVPMNLAMERGETEGRITTNLRALFASHPAGSSNFNVIVQIGMRPDKDHPNVPLLRNLARAPNETLVFDFISRTMALARPVATNDNVPAERVGALRRAFDATMKDADVLAEAKQQDLDISPWTGEKLQKTVIDIVDTAPAVLAQIRKAIESGSTSGERNRPAR